MILLRMYKTDHKFEKYFDIMDGKLLRSFVNVRMCNNILPIEKGRWLGLTTENVLLCNTNEVGDECHCTFNVLFSLKIEIQFYLQGDVETQIMYTVHKRKP